MCAKHYKREEKSHSTSIAVFQYLSPTSTFLYKNSDFKFNPSSAEYFPYKRRQPFYKFNRIRFRNVLKFFVLTGKMTNKTYLLELEKLTS